MSQASVGVDFTLETMQYKFATIIGELCGKPSILSQFAVWLDLRLAEYKLKGSISLDCSGQKPSPEWLHGLKDPANPVNPSYGEVLPESFSRHGSDQNIVQPARSKPFNRQNDRHSKPADFVVVKTEPNEDSRLFGENSHGSRVDRKRHTDSLSYDVFSPSKSRRISATSPRSTVDNSGFFPSQEQSGPNMVDLPTDDFDLMNRGSESSYDRGDNSTDMSYQRGENSDFYLGTGLGDDSVSSESIPLKSFQQQSDAEKNGCDGDVRLCKSLTEHFLGRLSVEGRANTSQSWNVRGSNWSSSDVSLLKSQGPNSTVRNAAAARGLFNRWLLQRNPEERRCLEEIPPEELDPLLANFFWEAKKLNGDEYNASSLQRIRCGIQHYLMEHGYQCSIMKSPFFSLSAQAIKERCKQLTLAAAEAVATPQSASASEINSVAENSSS